MLLIGIDGGATKVNAWEIKVINTSTTLSTSNQFDLGNINSICTYESIEGFNSGFQPLNLTIQLNQRQGGKIDLTQDEIQQGEVYISAVFKVIYEIAEKKRIKDLIIGIGMPGLKSSDGKGIEVIANGPRMPDYILKLEKKLNNAGLKLIHPVKRIGSDADYCGVGEEYAQNGLFKDIKNAYYMGGGTGIADVMKLNEELVFFDSAKDWIAKSWEMVSEKEKTFEEYISGKGIMKNYGYLIGLDYNEMEDKGIFPVLIAKQALENDKDSKKIIAQTAVVLAELLFERIHALYAGSDNEKKFLNPNRTKLNKFHPFLKSLWQRLIIGQRLGELWANILFKPIFHDIVIKELGKRIINSEELDIEAKKYYLPDGENLRTDLILFSKLRDAPALGAGIDAIINNK